MKITSIKTNLKKISISPPSAPLKKRTSNKKLDLSYQSDYSSLYNENNILNKNDLENEEYGYELDQSYDKNINIIQGNYNILCSNEKSNGENIEKNINKINKNNFIFKNERKILKYNINNIKDILPSYNINNNNGFIDNNSKYNDSNNINKEEYLYKDNIINQLKQYNYLDILKETLNNNCINDNNKYNIENNNNTDLISICNNYRAENKKIKKSIILQQILINEMKKEIETYKLEIENSTNKFLKEKKELNKIIENQKKEIDSIKKLNNIENDKFNGKKNREEINNCSIGQEENKNNLKEKNNIIKDIQNKNLNIIKINKDNTNNFIGDNNIIKEENFVKLINNSYMTIKQISNNIKFFNDNNLDDENIITKNLKDFIEHINSDNNGNISINDKLTIINEFNNIIKLELDLLFKYISNNNNTNLENLISDVDKSNNLNLNSNNLLPPENGQNNIRNSKVNTDNKKYYNNKIFKKIDIIINKNKLVKTNTIIDNLAKSKRFLNDNNRYKNINKSSDENVINKKNKSINNKIALSSNLLEKNSIVYKSNLSPLSLESSLNASNHNNFNSNYDRIMNKILDKNDIEENALNKIKNTKLNLKVKELADLITNNEPLNKKLKESNKSPPNSTFFKKFKKYKIPVPEDIKVSNTYNTNKIPVLNYINTNRNKFNEKRYRPIYKNTSGISGINHLNYTFDKIPVLSKHKTLNIKKNTSLSNNNVIKKIERNKISQLEYIKTDIKNNAEYIKITDIFKNSSNSNKISNSNTIDSKRNIEIIVDNIDKTPDKSLSSLENNSKYFNVKSNDNINDKNKPKIIIKPLKAKNKIISDLNGLTNEVMKPSFLKNNITMNMNINNNVEKDKGKPIFKEIKKLNLNLKTEIGEKKEKDEN